MKILLILSVFVNLLLAYLVVDTAISLDYSRMQVVALDKRSEVSLEIIKNAWIDKPRSALDLLCKNIEKKGFVYKTLDDQVIINDMVFILSNGRIANIEFL